MPVFKALPFGRAFFVCFLQFDESEYTFYEVVQSTLPITGNLIFTCNKHSLKSNFRR